MSHSIETIFSSIRHISPSNHEQIIEVDSTIKEKMFQEYREYIKQRNRYIEQRKQNNRMSRRLSSESRDEHHIGYWIGGKLAGIGMRRR